MFSLRTCIISVLCFTAIQFSLSGIVRADEDEILKLRSGIIKYWHDTFRLKEDDLRRIFGTMESQGRELTIATRTVIRISRMDDRFYETTSVDSALEDPNRIDHEIEFVRIELRIVDPNLVRDPWEPAYVAYVDFARSGSAKAKLKIVHKDRNWSLLTADAIEAQIERVFSGGEETPIWLILLVLVGVVLTCRFACKKYKHRTAAGVMLKTIFSWPAIFVGCLFLGFLLGYQTNETWYQTMFGPECGFEWGESLETLASRDDVRKNVFWVVIVGGAVSLAAGIVIMLLASETESSSECEPTSPKAC